MMSRTLLVRAPLVDQVIGQLRDAIAGGEWAVGARLPAEPVLAGQMGVGRSTVREAVRVLAHTGVLEVRQGAGTFVRAATAAVDLTVRLQRAGVMEVYEVRRALEVESAALAAARRSPEDLDRIEQALKARQAERLAGHAQEFLAADLAFHRAVVDAAHNPLLSELFACAAANIGRAIADVVADPQMTGDTSGLHSDLAAAVRAQDPHAAARAVRQHLDATSEALTRLVSP